MMIYKQANKNSPEENIQKNFKSQQFIMENKKDKNHNEISSHTQKNTSVKNTGVGEVME